MCFFCKVKLVLLIDSFIEERPGDSHDSSIFSFILSAIDNADQNNHVLITIPWLVEYLKCWKCMSSWNSTKVTSVLEQLILVTR